VQCNGEFQLSRQVTWKFRTNHATLRIGENFQTQVNTYYSTQIHHYQLIEQLTIPTQINQSATLSYSHANTNLELHIKVVKKAQLHACTYVEGKS